MKITAYQVTVNGRKLDVRQARVSAFPFNRVWSGVQRSTDQTEFAGFVSFDFNDVAEIEIEWTGYTPKSVEIRPLKNHLDYSVNGNSVHLKLTEPKHFVLELDGKSEALHVFANNVFSVRAEPEDIYFGPGEHFPGVIWPQSGQRVIIDENAVVYGAIFIHRADNVKILGRGILDASRLKRGNEAVAGQSGGEMMAKLLSEGFSVKDVQYTGAVVAYGCRNLEIDGIIIRDSMFWTLILRNHCANVVINNVKIIGQWRYNSDGINVCNSENVRITNCFIRSFDDCMVVRGAQLEGEVGGTRNVLVANCVMWCDWGISLEIWGGDKPTTIEGIRFENNYLIHLSSLAMDITTWFGSAETIIRNIGYQNIVIDDDDFYPAPQLQRNDPDRYVPPPESKKPKLLRVCCNKLGKNLGNQAHQPAENLDEYHLLYENINLNHIHADGNYEIEICPRKEVLKIRNLNVNLD